MEWKRLKNVVPHPVIKNKNLKSVYVTKDNVKEVQKELGFFEIFNEEVLLTGFLSFQRIPIYIIWINPKSHKTPRYYFANEHEIERYFEFLEDKQMLEIIDQRDALLEEKYLNDDWWYELDYWLNKRKSENEQIDIDRVLKFIEELKR